MGSSTGGNQECFVLRWNDFPTNVVTNLQEMRDENDFYDVTLACDEINFIQGHKVILSASSPYFKAILKRSPINQHPIVLMPPGIRFGDLVQLLDFIYNGEIKLASEDLNSFMALAEHLQIRGLTDDEKLKQQQFQQQQQQQQQKLPVKPAPKVPAAIHMVKRKGNLPSPSPATPLTSPGPATGQKRRRVEHQLQPEVNPEQQPLEYGEYDEASYNEQGYGETDQDQPPGGTAIQLTGLVCPHCRLVYHDVETLKDHIAGAHRVLQSADSEEANESVPCDICQKSFKNTKYMIQHQKRVHKLFPANSDSVKRGRPKKQQDYYAEDGPMEGEEERNMYEPSTSGLQMRQQQQQPQQQQQQTHVEPRPVGQVPPISRPLPKVNRGQARVQLDEGHVRQGFGGQVKTPPHRRPVGQHPRQPIVTPGEVYHPEPVPKRLPHPGPMHQGRPGPHHQLPNRPDIKNLGRKFGGQISITSNETQAMNRRPPPAAGEGSSGKFRPEMTAPPRSTPPQSRPTQQASNVPLPIPIQVKQEPVDEEFAEDEDDLEEEEDYGGDEEEEEGEMEDSEEYPHQDQQHPD